MGVTPKSSPALPGQCVIPEKNRENTSSLSFLPPCDTPRGCSFQSSSWPPAPLPSPTATGRSPQHPVTHPQLAWAAGMAWELLGTALSPSCSQQDPGIAQLSWRQEARREVRGQWSMQEHRERRILLSHHLPALSQGLSKPLSSCAVTASLEDASISQFPL